MKTDTIIRTVILFVALINQILTMCGINPIPISDDELYTLVSGIVLAASAIWAWWKNNSFTAAAQKADEVLAELKNAK